jgi:uncharacterized protein
MGLASDARVIEIGAGPGFFSPSISRSVPEGGLVVLDLQVEMLQLARARLTDRAGIGFVQADAMSLPFSTASVDAVLIATVLGEVPDPDACVAEARRVLRQGGMASFAETRRDSDFIGLASLTDLVQRHSLSFVDRRGFRWQYVARFRAI